MGIGGSRIGIVIPVWGGMADPISEHHSLHWALAVFEDLAAIVAVGIGYQVDAIAELVRASEEFQPNHG